MAKMSKAKDHVSAGYAALVSEAESAVAAVKDPELRRVAFEKILGTLLESGPSQTETKKPAAKSKAKNSTSRKKSKGSGSSTRQGPKAYIETMIEDGFFDEQRTIAEVKAELANQGRHIAITSLSGPLQKLTQERRLRRQKVASGGKNSKSAFAYSNW
ncbi:MAG: hypothetical protein AB7F91_00590 [Parvularculaceae bacterium]